MSSNNPFRLNQAAVSCRCNAASCHSSFTGEDRCFETRKTPQQRLRISHLSASAIFSRPRLALRSLKQDTVIGRLDFAGSGVKNVSKMRVVGGQWHVGAGGKPELFITNNKAAPEIPVQRKFELLNLA